MQKLKSFHCTAVRQQGWLLPFSLLYLVVGTTLMLSELDRVVLLSRLFQRVIEREQVLVEVTQDLAWIQQNGLTGSDFYPGANGVDQGVALWEVMSPASGVIVPVSEAEAGRCQFDSQLQVQTDIGRAQRRIDTWSVYGCVWFQSDESVVFYVPQTYW